MNFLKIEKLSLKNIRCFSSLNIDFKDGTNVITGENGSGKSTILTAIGFGLFGSGYLTGLKMEIKDMVQRGFGEGQIRLTFRTDKGLFESRHKIFIGKKQNEWIVRDVDQHKTLTRSITNSKEMISSKIGNNVDENIYKNALCSPQGQLSRLLELEDYKRKEQIRKILDLNQYDVTAIHIGKVLDKINEDETILIRDRNLIEDLTEDPKHWEEKKKDIVKKITLVKNELRDINTQIEVNSIEIKSQENLRDQINDDKTKLSIKDPELKTTIIEIDKIKDSISQKINEIHIEIKDKKDAERVFAELKSSDREAKKKLEGVKNRIRDHNKLNDELKEEEDTYKVNNGQLIELNQKKIEFEKNQDLESLKDELRESKNKFDQAEESRKTIVENKKEIADQVAKLSTSIENTQSKFNELYSESKSIFNVDPKELNTVKTNLELQKTVSRNELTKLDSELEQKQRNIGEIEAQIKLSQKTISLLSETGSDHNCPTCFRDFELTGRQELIDNHDQLIKTKLSQKEVAVGILLQHEKNERELESNIDNIITKEKKLAILLDRFDRSHEWLARVETEINKVKDLQIKDTELNSKLEEFSEVKIEELKKIIQEKNKLISSYDQIKTRLTVIQTKVDVISQTITRIRKELQSFDNQKDKSLDTQLSDDIAKFEIKINKVDSIKKEIGDKIELQNKRDTLESEITKLNELLAKNMEIFSEDKFLILKASKNEYIDSRGSYKNKLDDLIENKLPEITQILDNSKKDRKKFDEIVDKLVYYQNIRPKFEKVQAVMKTLPDKIINNISNQVSNQITSLLRRMLPDRGYDKAIFRGDGSVDLISKGEIVDRSNLSFGERTVLSIALRFALADYVAPLQFLVLDEPTNYLDTRRIREFVEIIDRDDLFRAGSGQLLLVTHREEFDRNANNSIHIKVNQDGTRSLS